MVCFRVEMDRPKKSATILENQHRVSRSSPARHHPLAPRHAIQDT
jgi:hypothetical protein